MVSVWCINFFIQVDVSNDQIDIITSSLFYLRISSSSSSSCIQSKLKLTAHLTEVKDGSFEEEEDTRTNVSQWMHMMYGYLQMCRQF